MNTFFHLQRHLSYAGEDENLADATSNSRGKNTTHPFDLTETSPTSSAPPSTDHSFRAQILNTIYSHGSKPLDAVRKEAAGNGPGGWRFGPDRSA